MGGVTARGMARAGGGGEAQERMGDVAAARVAMAVVLKKVAFL